MYIDGWWTPVSGSIAGLSWAVYFALIYRERSQRRNPVSLWAITIWIVAITAATAVWPAAQVLSGHATWEESALWKCNAGYAITALWTAFLILLARNPRGQWTRRIAAVLAVAGLLPGLLAGYALLRYAASPWERTFAQGWRAYPWTAFWQLALAPAINIFYDACIVLFPFAVWKENSSMARDRIARSQK
jgi:hypothetical protein